MFFNNFFEACAKAFYQGKPTVGTIKAVLMTDSYTFDDTDAFYSDLAGQATGAGVTAGGQAVNNLTITQDDVNNWAKIDFDNEVFSTVTVTNVNAYILYEDTGNPATSTLIAYIPFEEGAQSTVGGDFTIIPPAGGVHTIG